MTDPHENHTAWHCFPDPDHSGELYEVDEVPEDIYETVSQGGWWVEMELDDVIISMRNMIFGKIKGLASRQQGFGRRGDAGSTGARSVLVVHVTALDASTTSTPAQLSDSVFGTLGDPVNLKSQFAACSKGQLNLYPADRPGIVNGVVQVFIPTIVTGAEKNVIFTAAEDAVAAKFGSLSEFDHIMYCLPKGTNSRWLAYGYINSKKTVYNDVW